MTAHLPRDLALSLYGACLAEPFQERIKGYKRRMLTKEDATGARKRPIVLVSVRGRDLLADAVTGTLYDPVSGLQLGGQARLKI